jgi:hypothetical protein
MTVPAVSAVSAVAVAVELEVAATVTVVVVVMLLLLLLVVVVVAVDTKVVEVAAVTVAPGLAVVAAPWRVMEAAMAVAAPLMLQQDALAVAPTAMLAPRNGHGLQLLVRSRRLPRTRRTRSWRYVLCMPNNAVYHFRQPPALNPHSGCPQ